MPKKGLQYIGRHQSINIEDPPSGSDEEQAVDDFLKDYEKNSYVYEEGHENSAENALSQLFRVLNPGGHVCLRVPPESDSFVHYPRSVAIAQRYSQLRNLLQSKARLQFQRECCLKLRQSSALVREIETVCQEEFTTLEQINQHTITSPPSTRLDSLHAFCDELRTSINHWTSVKQLLLHNKWLRAQLPALSLEADDVRHALQTNVIAGMVWLERLCHWGFRVLSHCDDSTVTQAQLWKIARGLEDFNNICRLLKNQPAYRKHHQQLSLKVHEHRKQSSVQLHLLRRNCTLNVFTSFQPLSLSKVLSVLARERSHYAAAIFQQYVTSHPKLLSKLRAARSVTSPWFHTPDAPLLESVKQNGDFRSASVASVSDVMRTRSGDATRASSRCFVSDWSIAAADLSEGYSPLEDFANRTSEFASSFLQVVSHSTQLLARQPQPLNQLQALALKGASLEAFDVNNVDDVTRAGASPSLKLRPDLLRLHMKQHREDDDISLASDVSFLSSSRKSVTWGDAGEASQVRYVVQRFMRQTWRSFDAELSTCFMFPVTSAGLAGAQCGSVVLCSDEAALTLVKTLQQAANSGEWHALIPP